MAKRRGNGEGSITRHKKSGLYMARYVVETLTGPKRKTIYGKEREEVAAKLADALSDRNKGLVFDADNLKVGEYLDRWLNDSLRDTVRQRTWERYEQIVRVHLKPAFGRMKLKNLTTTHARAHYREKLDTGLAPRTVNYIHTTLSKALKDAVADGLIPRNVTEGVVAITAGLREGELLGLKWEDVDLESGKLSVRRTLSESSERGHIFEPPKNGKGRNIRLAARAVKSLRDHLQRQLDEIEQTGDLYRDQGLVFPTTVGTPMNQSNLTSRSFKPLLERAGLPRTVRLHDLRHTCATLLLCEGVHPKLVQELLGHANISITLDTYSHVLPGMGDQTATAMENVLS